MIFIVIIPTAKLKFIFEKAKFKFATLDRCCKYFSPLLYQALPVRHYQLAEVFDLHHKFLASVGVADEHTVVLELFELDAAVDVRTFLNRLFLALKWLVLNQLQAVRIVYQRVARNARGLVVGFGESAVDDKTLAARPHRRFAVSGADGDVSVDDARFFGVESKFAHNVVAGVGVVGEDVVRTLLLLAELLVVDEITLESGHLVLVVKRRIGAAPQVPHIVESL